MKHKRYQEIDYDDNHNPFVKTDWTNITGFAFLGFLVLFVVFAIVFGVTLSRVSGANGQHVGIVTAVEDAENITWNSTLVYIKTDPESTQEDTYCIVDPQVRQSLDRYVVTRERVSVKYRHSFPLWRWNCNGGSSIVYAVEMVE